MKVFAVFLLLIPLTGTADDPFACVAPGVREAFLPGYPNLPQYSTDVPSGFPELAVPRSFVLIGSQISDSFASVVYESDDGIEQAISNVVTSLEENGWQDIGRAAGFASRGFQASVTPRYHRLCHDDGPSMLTVSTRDVSDSTYMTVSVMPVGDAQSCSEPANGSREIIRHMSLAEEIPDLKLPKGVRTYNAGSGGGGDDYQTSILVSAEISRESLVSFLNDQIRDQGWNSDGAWSGNLSSGSAWFKESAKGDLIIGSLHAFGDSRDKVNLRFSINLADTDQNRGTMAIGIGMR